MKQFTYVIKADFTMHFGPTGRLAELARLYADSNATIEMGNRIEDISHPLKVINMGIRKDDKVTVTVKGPSEVELIDVLYQYFEDKM